MQSYGIYISSLWDPNDGLIQSETYSHYRKKSKKCLTQNLSFIVSGVYNATGSVLSS